MAAFNETLELEPERAFYGVRHVEKANAANAIQTLLVSDALFRSKDIKDRISAHRRSGVLKRVKDEHLIAGQRLGRFSVAPSIFQHIVSSPVVTSIHNAFCGGGCRHAL